MPLSTLMFLAVLFTIAEKWKKCTCPLMNEQIKKMGIYAYNGKLFSLKWKEILRDDATMWMHLENIRLSEINQ